MINEHFYEILKSRRRHRDIEYPWQWFVLRGITYSLSLRYRSEGLVVLREAVLQAVSGRYNFRHSPFGCQKRTKNHKSYRFRNFNFSSCGKIRHLEYSVRLKLILCSAAVADHAMRNTPTLEHVPVYSKYNYSLCGCDLFPEILLWPTYKAVCCIDSLSCRLTVGCEWLLINCNNLSRLLTT